MKPLKVDECIKEIKNALKMFGEYSYYDKGASEVMDLDSFVNKAKQMNPKDLGKVLCEVLKYEHGKMFVGDIISDCDDMDDEWWNELMDYDKRIEELY